MPAKHITPGLGEKSEVFTKSRETDGGQQKSSNKKQKNKKKRLAQ